MPAPMQSDRYKSSLNQKLDLPQINKNLILSHMPLTPDNVSDMSLLPSKLSATTHGFPGFKSPQFMNHNENRFRFKDDNTIEGNS